MTDSTPDPPEVLSEQLVTELTESSDRQLRAIIDYAQQLLTESPALTDSIEPREGERIVRTEDEGHYTTVIVERPDESGEERGPFAYLVRYEPEVGGEGGQYRWHYLGHVEETSGD